MKPDFELTVVFISSNPFPVCRRVKSARRNVRRTSLLLATLLLFIVCWLPLNILNLGEDLNMPLRSWRLGRNKLSEFHLAYSLCLAEKPKYQKFQSSTLKNVFVQSKILMHPQKSRIGLRNLVLYP